MCVQKVNAGGFFERARARDGGNGGQLVGVLQRSVRSCRRRCGQRRHNECSQSINARAQNKNARVAVAADMLKSQPLLEKQKSRAEPKKRVHALINIYALKSWEVRLHAAHTLAYAAAAVACMRVWRQAARYFSFSATRIIVVVAKFCSRASEAKLLHAAARN